MKTTANEPVKTLFTNAVNEVGCAKLVSAEKESKELVSVHEVITNINTAIGHIEKLIYVFTDGTIGLPCENEREKEMFSKFSSLMPLIPKSFNFSDEFNGKPDLHVGNLLNYAENLLGKMHSINSTFVQILSSFDASNPTPPELLGDDEEPLCCSYTTLAPIMKELEQSIYIFHNVANDLYTFLGDFIDKEGINREIYLNSMDFMVGKTGFSKFLINFYQSIRKTWETYLDKIVIEPMFHKIQNDDEPNVLSA